MEELHANGGVAALDEADPTIDMYGARIPAPSPAPRPARLLAPTPPAISRRRPGPQHPGRYLSTGGLKSGPATPAAPAQRLEVMDVEAAFSHLPVMVREVVELLLPVPDGLIVDCTVGGGGHAAALLEARSDIRLLGIDRDADAVAAARLRLAPFGGR